MHTILGAFLWFLGLLLLQDRLFNFKVSTQYLLPVHGNEGTFIASSIAESIMRIMMDLLHFNLSAMSAHHTIEIGKDVQNVHRLLQAMNEKLESAGRSLRNVEAKSRLGEISGLREQILGM